MWQANKEGSDKLAAEQEAMGQANEKDRSETNAFLLEISKANKKDGEELWAAQEAQHQAKLHDQEELNAMRQKGPMVLAELGRVQKVKRQIREKNFT
jgi:hypothetical protein